MSIILHFFIYRCSYNYKSPKLLLNTILFRKAILQPLRGVLPPNFYHQSNQNPTKGCSKKNPLMDSPLLAFLNFHLSTERLTEHNISTDMVTLDGTQPIESDIDGLMVYMESEIGSK